MNEMSLLTRLADRLPDPPPGALTGARTAVLAGIAARTGPHEARRSRRSRFALAAGLGAAAAAVLLLVQTATPDLARHTGATAAAATALRRAADGTLRTSDPVQRPGQYLYLVDQGQRQVIVTTAGPNPGSQTSPRPFRFEEWLPYDRSQPWLIRQDVGGGTSQQWVPGGTFTADQVNVDGWQWPTASFLADLPTDPRALLDRAYHDRWGEGPDRDAEAFTTLTDLLGNAGRVPAAIRARTLRALALIPGVTLRHGPTGQPGRTGITVAKTGNGVRQEFTFDAHTGAVIGGSQVLAEPRDGRPAGTVLSTFTVHSAVVDRAGQVG